MQCNAMITSQANKKLQQRALVEQANSVQLEKAFQLHKVSCWDFTNRYPELDKMIM